MTKINSRQRRSNRFVKRGCAYPGCPCGDFTLRWTIAYDRRMRRTMRRIENGKSPLRKFTDMEFIYDAR